MCEPVRETIKLGVTVLAAANIQEQPVRRFGDHPRQYVEQRILLTIVPFGI